MDKSELVRKCKELEAVCKEFHPGISCRVADSFGPYEKRLKQECWGAPLKPGQIYAYVQIPKDVKQSSKVPIDQMVEQLLIRLYAFKYVGRVFLQTLKD